MAAVESGAALAREAGPAAEAEAGPVAEAEAAQGRGQGLEAAPHGGRACALRSRRPRRRRRGNGEEGGGGEARWGSLSI